MSYDAAKDDQKTRGSRLVDFTMPPATAVVLFWLTIHGLDSGIVWQ